MLKRKIGERVYVNTNSFEKGTIIDTKENNKDLKVFYDYLIKFDTPMIFIGIGVLKQKYYTETELDEILRKYEVLKLINDTMWNM